MKEQDTSLSQSLFHSQTHRPSSSYSLSSRLKAAGAESLHARSSSSSSSSPSPSPFSLVLPLSPLPPAVAAATERLKQKSAILAAASLSGGPTDLTSSSLSSSASRIKSSIERDLRASRALQRLAREQAESARLAAVQAREAEMRRERARVEAEKERMTRELEREKMERDRDRETERERRDSMQMEAETTLQAQQRALATSPLTSPAQTPLPPPAFVASASSSITSSAASPVLLIPVHASATFATPSTPTHTPQSLPPNASNFTAHQFDDSSHDEKQHPPHQAPPLHQQFYSQSSLVPSQSQAAGPTFFPSPSPIQGTASARAEVASLQRIIHSLQSELAALKVANAAKAADEHTASSPSSPTSVSSLSLQKLQALLDGERQSHTLTKQQLDRTLAARQTDAEEAEKLRKGLMDERDALREQLRSTQVQLEDSRKALQDEKERLSRAVEQIASQKKQIELLMDTSSSTNSKVSQALGAERSRNSTLFDQLQQARDDAADSHNQLRLQTMQLEEARRALATTQKQLDQTQQEMEAMRKQHAEDMSKNATTLLEEQRAHAQTLMQAQSIEAQLHALQQEFDTLSTAVAGLPAAATIVTEPPSHNGSVDSTRPPSATSFSRRASSSSSSAAAVVAAHAMQTATQASLLSRYESQLQSLLLECESAKLAQSDLERTLESNQVELSDWANKYEQQRATIESLQRDKEQWLLEQEKERSSWKLQQTELNNQLQHLRSQLTAEDEVKALQQKFASLEREHRDVKELLEKERDRYVELESNSKNEQRDLEQALKSKQAELDEMQHTLGQLQSTLDSLEGPDGRIAKLQSALSANEDREMAAVRREQEALRKLEQLQCDLTNQSKLLSEAKAAHADAESQLADSLVKCASLQSSLDETQAQHQSTKQSLVSTEKQLASSREECDDLRRQLDLKSHELDTRHKDYNTLLKQQEVTERKNVASMEALQEKVESMRQDLGKAHKLHQTDEERMEQLQQKIARLEAEGAALRKEVESKDTSISTHLASIRHLESSLADLTASKQSLEESNDLLIAQRKKVEEQLSKAQTQIEPLLQSIDTKDAELEKVNLTMKLAEKEAERRLKSMSNERNDAQHTVEELQAQLQSQSKVISDYKVDIASMHAELVEKERFIHDLQTNTLQPLQENAATTANLLEKERQYHIQQRQEWNKREQDLQESMLKQRTESDQALADLKASMLADAQRRVEEAEKRLQADHESALQQSTETLSLLRTQLQTTEVNLSDARSRAQKAGLECERTRERIRTVEREMENLNAALEREKQHASQIQEDASERYNRTLHECNQLDKELNEERLRIQTLTLERDELQAQRQSIIDSKLAVERQLKAQESIVQHWSQRYDTLLKESQTTEAEWAERWQKLSSELDSARQAKTDAQTDAQRETQKLKLELSACEQQMSVQLRDLQAARDQVVALKQQLVTTEQELIDALSSHKTLESRLSSESAAKQRAHESEAKLREQLREYTATKNELESDLADMRHELTAAQSATAAASTSNDQLTKQLSDIRDRLSAQASALRDSESELLTLRHERDEWLRKEEQYNEAARKAERDARTLSELQAAQRSAEEARADVERRLEQAKAEVAQATKECESLRQERDACKDEARRTERELNIMRETHAKLADMMEEQAARMNASMSTNDRSPLKDDNPKSRVARSNSVDAIRSRRVSFIVRENNDDSPLKATPSHPSSSSSPPSSSLTPAESSTSTSPSTTSSGLASTAADCLSLTNQLRRQRSLLDSLRAKEEAWEVEKQRMEEERKAMEAELIAAEEENAARTKHINELQRRVTTAEKEKQAMMRKLKRLEERSGAGETGVGGARRTLDSSHSDSLGQGSGSVSARLSSSSSVVHPSSVGNVSPPVPGSLRAAQMTLQSMSVPQSPVQSRSVRSLELQVADLESDNERLTLVNTQLQTRVEQLEENLLEHENRADDNEEQVAAAVEAATHTLKYDVDEARHALRTLQSRFDRESSSRQRAQESETRLREQVRSLHEANAELETRLNELQYEAAESVSAVASLTTNEDAAAKTMAQLRQKIAIVMAKRRESESALIALRRLYEESQIQLKRYKEEAKRADNDARTLAAVQASVRLLEDARDEAQSREEHAMHEASELRKQIESLKRARDSSMDDARMAQRDLQLMRGSYAHLTKLVEDQVSTGGSIGVSTASDASNASLVATLSQAERAASDRAIQHFNEQLQAWRQKEEAWIAERTAMLAQLQTAEAELMRSREQSRQRQQETQQLIQEVRAGGIHRKRLASLPGDNSAAKGAAATAAADDLASSTLDDSSMDASLMSSGDASVMENRLEVYESELHVLRSRLREMELDAAARSTRVGSSNDAFVRSLGSPTSVSTDSDVASLRGEISSLRSALHAAEKRRLDLSAALEQSEWMRESKERALVKAQMEAEWNAKELAAKDAAARGDEQSHARRAQEMRTQMAKLEESKSMLQTELRATRIKLHETERNAARVNELEHELRTHVHKEQSLQRAFDDAQSQVSSLESRLRSLQERHDAVSRSLQESQSLCASFSTRLSQAMRESETREARLRASMEEEIADREARVKIIEGQRARLQEELDQLTRKVTTLEHEQTQVSASKQPVARSSIPPSPSNSTSALVAASSRLRSMQCEVESLQHELSMSRRNESRMREELERMEAMMKENEKQTIQTMLQAQRMARAGGEGAAQSLSVSSFSPSSPATFGLSNLFSPSTQTVSTPTPSRRLTPATPSRSPLGSSAGLNDEFASVADNSQSSSSNEATSSPSSGSKLAATASLSSSSSASVTQLTIHLQCLQQEHALLQSKSLQRHAEYQCELDELRARHTEAMAATDRLREELTRVQHEKQRVMERLEELNETHVRLQAESLEARQSVATADSQMQHTNRTLDTITAELDASRARIRELQQSITARDDSIMELRGALAEATAARDALQSQLTTARDSIVSMTSRVDGLESSARVARTESEVSAAREAELRSQLNRMPHMEQEMRTLRASLSEAQKEIELLRARTERASEHEGSCETHRQQHENEMRTLRSRLDVAQDECANLSAQLSIWSQKESLWQSERDSLRMQLNHAMQHAGHEVSESAAAVSEIQAEHARALAAKDAQVQSRLAELYELEQGWNEERAAMRAEKQRMTLAVATMQRQLHVARHLMTKMSAHMQGGPELSTSEHARLRMQVEAKDDVEVRALLAAEAEHEVTEGESADCNDDLPLQNSSALKRLRQEKEVLEAALQNAQRESRELEQKLSTAEKAALEKEIAWRAASDKAAEVAERAAKAAAETEQNLRTELAALKESSEQQIWTMQQEHDHVVAQLKSDHQRVMTQRAAEHERIITQLISEHERVTKQQAAEHERIVTELTSEHERIVTQQASEHETEITSLCDKHTALLTSMRDQHAHTVNSMRQKHEDEIAGLREHHANNVAKIRAEHQSQVEALTRECETQLDDLRASSQQKLDAEQQRLSNEISQQRHTYETDQNRLKDEMEAQRQRLTDEMEMLRQKLGAQVSTLQSSLKQTREDLNNVQHDADSLRARCSVLAESLKQVQQHRDDLQSRVDRLRTIHEQQLLKQKSDADALLNKKLTEWKQHAKELLESQAALESQFTDLHGAYHTKVKEERLRSRSRLNELESLITEASNRFVESWPRLMKDFLDSFDDGLAPSEIERELMTLKAQLLRAQAEIETREATVNVRAKQLDEEEAIVRQRETTVAKGEEELARAKAQELVRLIRMSIGMTPDASGAKKKASSPPTNPADVFSSSSYWSNLQLSHDEIEALRQTLVARESQLTVAWKQVEAERAEERVRLQHLEAWGAREEERINNVGIKQVERETAALEESLRKAREQNTRLQWKEDELQMQIVELTGKAVEQLSDSGASVNASVDQQCVTKHKHVTSQQPSEPARASGQATQHNDSNGDSANGIVDTESATAAGADAAATIASLRSELSTLSKSSTTEREHFQRRMQMLQQAWDENEAMVVAQRQRWEAEKASMEQSIQQIQIEKVQLQQKLVKMQQYIAALEQDLAAAQQSSAAVTEHMSRSCLSAIRYKIPPLALGPLLLLQDMAQNKDKEKDRGKGSAATKPKVTVTAAQLRPSYGYTFDPANPQRVSIENEPAAKEIYELDDIDLIELSPTPSERERMTLKKGSKETKIGTHALRLSIPIGDDVTASAASLVASPPLPLRRSASLGVSSPPHARGVASPLVPNGSAHSAMSTSDASFTLGPSVMTHTPDIPAASSPTAVSQAALLSAQQRLHELSQQQQAVQARNAELEQQVAARDDEVSQLKKEVEQLRQQLATSRQHHQQLQQQHERIQLQQQQQLLQQQRHHLPDLPIQTHLPQHQPQLGEWADDLPPSPLPPSPPPSLPPSGANTPHMDPLHH